MSDAQWVLDIAAAMPAGAQTIGELDKLTESLVGAGRRSDSFQQAMKQLSSQLDVAKAASAAANAALSDGSDVYKVLEREALKASKALERATAKGAVPPEVASQAARAKSALDAYAVTLERLEKDSNAASASQKKYELQLANVHKIAGHVDERNQKAAQRYGKIAEAANLLPGPLGRIVGMSARAGKAGEELSATFGKAGASTLLLAAGAAVAVLAVAALTAAAVAGYVAFGAYAVAAADAAREANLTREAFAALSDSTAAGEAAFDAVSDATGATDAELIALTKQLRAAKVAAADMPAALRAAAMAEAALGKGGAGEFVDRLREGTLAVDDFAREVDAKFGGVVAARLRGLDGQTARFKRLWAGLFSGVNLEPVLDALGVLVGMFDRANPLAQFFGATIEGAFSPISKWALDAAYAVEAFALGFAIQLTKLYIAVKPALAWLADLFGFNDPTTTETFEAITLVGQIFAGVAVVGAVVIGALAAAFVALGAALLGPLALFGAIQLALFSLFTYVRDLIPGMVQVGSDLLGGLVQGITGAVGSVVSAVTGAVTKAIDVAKDVLGISSPSKVFAEIGGDTAAGYSQGVEAGTPEAQGSLAAMVSPTDAAAGTSTASGTREASSGGRAGADLAGATFNFYGVADAENAIDRFREMLTNVFEGDADSLNGARVPT